MTLSCWKSILCSEGLDKLDEELPGRESVYLLKNELLNILGSYSSVQQERLWN